MCAGLTPEEAKEKPFIASMGIYVFKKQVLIDLLTEVGVNEGRVCSCCSSLPCHAGTCAKKDLFITIMYGKKDLFITIMYGDQHVCKTVCAWAHIIICNHNVWGSVRVQDSMRMGIYYYL